MKHRHCFEAVSRTFQNIRNDSRALGGITMLLSGDFRQCLPVVVKGSQGQIEAASITASFLWQYMTRLHLLENKRVLRMAMTEEERVAAGDHARWLLKGGR